MTFVRTTAVHAASRDWTLVHLSRSGRPGKVATNFTDRCSIAVYPALPAPLRKIDDADPNHPFRT